jgi:hypothetical protein
MTRRVLVLVALASLIAGCLGANPSQGDPSAPVLVRGVVLDAAGQPVGGAPLTLSVSDWTAELQPGDSVPVLFSRQYTARPDGGFEIRLWPGDVLREAGGGPVEFINFDLAGMARPNQVGLWAFPREVRGAYWTGEVPEVTLRPLLP